MASAVSPVISEDDDGYEAGMVSAPKAQSDPRPKRQSYEVFSPRGAPSPGAARGRAQTMDLRVPGAVTRPEGHQNYLHDGMLRKVGVGAEGILCSILNQKGRPRAAFLFFYSLKDT
jgi:hypothetical protein